MQLPLLLLPSERTRAAPVAREAPKRPIVDRFAHLDQRMSTSIKRRTATSQTITPATTFSGQPCQIKRPAREKTPSRKSLDTASLRDLSAGQSDVLDINRHLTSHARRPLLRRWVWEPRPLPGRLVASAQLRRLRPRAAISQRRSKVQGALLQRVWLPSRRAGAVTDRIRLRPAHPRAARLRRMCCLIGENVMLEPSHQWKSSNVLTRSSLAVRLSWQIGRLYRRGQRWLPHGRTLVFRSAHVARLRILSDLARFLRTAQHNVAHPRTSQAVPN